MLILPSSENKFNAKHSKFTITNTSSLASLGGEYIRLPPNNAKANSRLYHPHQYLPTSELPVCSWFNITTLVQIEERRGKAWKGELEVRRKNMLKEMKKLKREAEVEESISKESESKSETKNSCDPACQLEKRRKFDILIEWFEHLPLEVLSRLRHHFIPTTIILGSP